VIRPGPSELAPLPPAELSVVVVTHGHAATIERCLRALREAAPPGAEVLLLDNASADGTAALARTVPGVRVHETGANLGFSAAMNLGIRAARSPLVLALGPDVLVQRGFFEALVPALGPGAAMAGALLLDLADPARIDDAGTLMTRGRQFKSRGAGEPDQGRYPAGDVLGVCGGCCLLRRDAAEDLLLDGELFDEDFFAYKEDVDLGWRAHLLGWTCRFEPRARALHARQGGRSGSPFMMQLSVRNRLLLLLKNEDASGFALHLPELAAFELYQLHRHRAAYRLERFGALARAMLRKRRLLFSRRRLGPAQMRARLRRLRRALPVQTGRDPR
jgi:GT2 family glycosyltransferase